MLQILKFKHNEQDIKKIKIDNVVKMGSEDSPKMSKDDKQSIQEAVAAKFGDQIQELLAELNNLNQKIQR
jgi:hypothetical protein